LHPESPANRGALVFSLQVFEQPLKLVGLELGTMFAKNARNILFRASDEPECLPVAVLPDDLRRLRNFRVRRPLRGETATDGLESLKHRPPSSGLLLPRA